MRSELPVQLIHQGPDLFLGSRPDLRRALDGSAGCAPADVAAMAIAAASMEAMNAIGLIFDSRSCMDRSTGS